MGIITKRNGSIFMKLGVLVTFIGFFGGIFYALVYGDRWAYAPLGVLLAFFMVLIGPGLSLLGIPLFIIGSIRLRKVPQKLVDSLKHNMHIKISSLAQQFKIDENDLKNIIFKLQARGEPILINHSTLEVMYTPTPPPSTLSSPQSTLTPPTREMTESSTEWTSYEKLSLLIAIIGILISIIVALTR